MPFTGFLMKTTRRKYIQYVIYTHIAFSTVMYKNGPDIGASSFTIWQQCTLSSVYSRMIWTSHVDLFATTKLLGVAKLCGVYVGYKEITIKKSKKLILFEDQEQAIPICNRWMGKTCIQPFHFIFIFTLTTSKKFDQEKALRNLREDVGVTHHRSK